MATSARQTAITLTAGVLAVLRAATGFFDCGLHQADDRRPTTNDYGTNPGVADDSAAPE